MENLRLLLAILPILLIARAAQGGKPLTDGEYWREHALKDIIPYWLKYAKDEEYGAFHTGLSREWQPTPPWDKYPPMISRQVFGFSAGYLLSGEEKYMEAARMGVDYLLEHAWDSKYGGWFDLLTRKGEPKAETKSVAVQLYTNVGLTLYYFVTGDERALSFVKKSTQIRRTHAYDKEFGGYFQVLNRDLTPRDDSKRKHSHFGYLGSLLPDLYMATRDADVLNWAEELAQITMERMTDGQNGWVDRNYDRQWNLLPEMVGEKEVISAGAQLTTVLAFLRLYLLTGKEVYRDYGVTLGDQTIRWAWDSERGGWHDEIEKVPPHSWQGRPDVSFWVQYYGSFLQLQLYHITGDGRYLEQFQKGATFWKEYFPDREFGGAYATVLADGSVVNAAKAEPWRTSYHEMEHALLNYLYLNLYVNRQPVTLHFLLRDTSAGSKHFVSLAEDPSVQIAEVRIDGKPWTNFDARERSVILPQASEVKMEVVLAPGNCGCPKK